MQDNMRTNERRLNLELVRIIAIMAGKMTESKCDISFKYRAIRLGKGK